MKDSYNRVYAKIDLDAVDINMREMQSNIRPDAKMIGVIKTDGYGHGAVPIAKTIDKYVCAYAVATADEGINLRKNGIKKTVFLLGPVHPSRYKELIINEICPVFFEYDAAREYSDEAVSLGKKAPIHLALDTGMNRIGMSPDDQSADMVCDMSKLPGIEIIGMFTHFAKADETDKTSTYVQMERYNSFIQKLEKRGVDIPLKHCSNSAGIIDIPDANMDAVRAGISIYGLYPSDEVNKRAIMLMPVMSLHSFITYIKTIHAGDSVSYGGTYTAHKDTRVATIPVGYGDGYPRNLSNKGYVLIDGKKAKILGRVCMDQFMVDVSDIPDAKEWQPVTLIGKEENECITVENLASWGGGFHYEIICDIGKRVPRVYIRHGQEVGSKDYFEDIYNDFI